MYLSEDLLVASNARVVVVASDAHYEYNIKMKDLEGEPIPSLFEPLPEGSDQNAKFKKYAASNRARVYFAKELCKRYPEITAVSLHPGLVNTEIIRDIEGCWFGCYKCIFRMGKTPEQGAATSVHCATEEKVAEQRGEYFVSCKVKSLKEKLIDEEVQVKLWEVSEKFCKENGGAEN